MYNLRGGTAKAHGVCKWPELCDIECWSHETKKRQDKK